jgi:hypothetical protein
MHVLFAALGRELGDRYDATLSKTIGPHWLQALSNILGKWLNLYDPHFVLHEPLVNAESPTRECLPHGPAFYNLLDDALQVRNRWSHHEIVYYDLVTLRESVKTIHKVATAAEMALGAHCAAIIKRIKDIESGAYQPQGRPVETAAPDVQLDAIQADLLEAELKQRQLLAEVEAAQALLDEAALQQDELQEQRARERAALLAQLGDAQGAVERLQYLVESLQAQKDGVPTEEVTFIDVLPGHRWTTDLPERRTLLMALSNDLFDQSSQQPIAQEFGDSAPDTIAGWKQTVPAASTIFLTRLGQAVVMIDGAPIYLGTLGEVPEGGSTPSQAAGFFLPQAYTLHASGRIEDRASGDVLQAVNPDGSREIVRQLKALMPKGGRLRVTTTGDVAQFVNGEWRVVANVASASWFPGHLN